MILYENSVKNFIESASNRRITSFFSDEYEQHFSRKTESKTKTYWKYVTQILKEMLIDSRISDDAGIRIDYVINSNFQWVEVLLVGIAHSELQVHLIELLPFTSLINKKAEEVYCFDNDGEEVEFLHPSMQSVCYKGYLTNNLSVVSMENIQFYSCVYLFECEDTNTKDVLRNEQTLIDEVPIFVKGEEAELQQRLSLFSDASDGKYVLQLLHNKDQLCAAGLEAYIQSMNNDENSRNNGLFAEQKYISANIISSIQEKAKNVFVVNGYPGTGKTTLAISIMKSAYDKGYHVLFLCGTKLMVEMIKKTMEQNDAMNDRVRVSTVQAFLSKKEEVHHELIIIDESHNTGIYFWKHYVSRDDGVPRTFLFLFDMAQCISGLGQNLLDSLYEDAPKIKYEIRKNDLNSNIRFSGKASGINWLTHQLQLADTGNYDDWDKDTYKIELVNDPNSIPEIISNEKKKGNFCRAIVYYHTISSISMKYGEPAIGYDMHNFIMPVITVHSPYASKWYKDDDLSNYAVSVRLVQGVELDYACVLIDGLTYDKEAKRVVLRKDSTQVEDEIKRGQLRNESELDDMIKGLTRKVLAGYYVALSRGKKGVYIYCSDDALKEYLSEKLKYATRRFSWIKEFISKYDYDSEKGIVKREDCESESTKNLDQYSYVTRIYEQFNDLIEEIKRSIDGKIDEDDFKVISDKCSTFLLELQKDAIENDELVKDYRKTIIEHMGKPSWDKLSDLSKKCLLSAEIIFHDLKDYNQIFDFSGVCIQVSKAVEYELAYRYLKKYTDYLAKKYGNRLMDRIPRSLMDGSEIITMEKYTLGSVRFTVGMDPEGNVVNNYVYREFEKYAKECLWSNCGSLQSKVAEHIRIVHKIKEDYRNKAAHKSSVDAIAAEECLKYVVEVERKLGYMLDEYKY